MDRAPGHQHSPTQIYANPYPPSERHARHRSSSYNAVQHSPTSTTRYPPTSPTTRPTSSYYDPTGDARSSIRDTSVNNTLYSQRSPVQGRPTFDQPPHASPYVNGNHAEHRNNMSRPTSRPSPRVSTHAQPAATPTHDARSPIAYDPVRGNGAHPRASRPDSPTAQPQPQPQTQTPPPPPPPPPQRSSNPMSMMNILSDSATTPASPAPKPSAPVDPAPPTKSSNRKANRASQASSNGLKGKEEAHEQPRASLARASSRDSLPAAHERGNRASPVLPAQNGPPSLTIRDTEAAWKEIEARDLSDIEADVPEIEQSQQEWLTRNHKHSLEVEINENMKRKRRRRHLLQKYHDHFSTAAECERVIYIDKHEHEVAEEVRLKEIEEDKERKKDQQRKRRREKAIADEQQKREEALQSLATVKDEDEKARIERDIQRHDKKIRDTQSRLQGITPSKETRNESPHNAAALGRREREVAMEGGLMTSFYSNNTSLGNEDGTPEFTASGRGRGRGGRGGGGGSGGGTGRAKKSKEQKQAEKDNARLGHMLDETGQDHPPLAQDEAKRLAGYADRKLREDSDPLSESAPTTFDLQPTAGLTGMAKFDSKGYNQIYEQITRDLAKGVPKVVRIKNNSLDTKQSNARKTAQLAAKEARRWQLRTNKSTKDVAARAKRAMREMLGFWKRNERDEREGRKAAERQELDKARRAEAEREANRQKRKLNFLISQTELYSHFIRKKVKTDEIEKEGTDADGVQPNGQTVIDDPRAKHLIDLPDSVANLSKKVTNFEDLDFDADDETALQEAAMANAQNAIQQAQDRARAFNKPDGDSHDLADAQANFDEGEMNFQNPTSLQSMDVSQPKMLSCQLKEYQLKGLNWLVNLYEQGINGILADEMGLGKTVQSISVMAYLAEVHNIWGPFLVIAPASTLHNWQQEITKFVPEIKTLPYWGSAKDRKVLRKFWDRKHITYNRDSPFHVLVTSYQLVVADTAYFQKVKWQYMILDEAQAIKSSQSSRWKSLLGFHCRNRLLLTGTPIQNNMQELWALLHFIMPSLFDSHDEFSEWFSKDIENHAQSNSKLNEDQLRRLHMILKPFMLRRIKKHVQKELGDKIEEDLFCDLTYRQRAYYTNLRNKISIMDLIEKAAVGDDQDTATLMNLVMQFRKVCNHPDLFERAETWSPMSMTNFAETASFMREGHSINVSYSAQSAIQYWLPKMLSEAPGRLDLAGPENPVAGWRNKWLHHDLSIWEGQHILNRQSHQGAFSWLRFVDQSAGEVARTARSQMIDRVLDLAKEDDRLTKLQIAYGDADEHENFDYVPAHAMLNIVNRKGRKPLADITSEGHLQGLFNIAQTTMLDEGLNVIETCYFPSAMGAPVELVCAARQSLVEKETTFFSIPTRRALYPVDLATEQALLQSRLPLSKFPVTNLLPAPESEKQRYTKIQVPSMRRFVTDSGKLARLDQLLRELKEGGHRVLLYFQMTRMIDLMEEYLTYRNYKYCRLDGSTKLEDRRDTVAAFQSSPEIFIFLLSTRAGGLGINLTSADTVIFYDSDWNPTIDSQAMDRAHRLGQTRQVTVYRLITRGTIEERIRKRALQKEEVQRVVISGQPGTSIDFNNRSRENNRTKEMAMWLADDDQAAAIERREAEVLEEEAKTGGKGRKRKSGVAVGKKKEVSMDDMYHEGEGKFEDGASHEPSGAATPVSTMEGGPPIKKRKGLSKKAKTVRQRLAVVDGEVG